MINKKKVNRVKYLNSLGSTITNGARWSRALNSGLHGESRIPFQRQIQLKFKEETSKVTHLKHSFVWNWNLGTSESRSKAPLRIEMWCCRRSQKISATDRVGNEELWHRSRRRRTSYIKKRRKINWIGHILRRNCFINYVRYDGRIIIDGKKRK